MRENRTQNHAGQGVTLLHPDPFDMIVSVGRGSGLGARSLETKDR